MAKRHLHPIMIAAVAVMVALVLPCTADETLPATQENVVQDTGSTAPPIVPVVQDALYKIQAEDILQIDVWGEPTLQKIQLQVTPDGNIDVAYIGNIKVAGMTTQDLSDAIKEKLKAAEILVDPKVQVTVISVHKLQVRVLGQVQRPGLVEVKDGDTVIEAIAQAGSYIPDVSDLEGATITRRDSEKSEPLNLKALFQKGDLSQNLVLKTGDIIYIPEDTKNKFYVMGEVIRPGQYQLRDNTTILGAIMLAGSSTPRASMKSTVLIRNGQRVPVDMAKLIGKADVTQNVPLEPGDVVYVPETHKPDWGKIGQILNAITSLSFVRRYGLF